MLHAAPSMLHVVPSMQHVVPSMQHAVPSMLHVAPSMLHAVPSMLHAAPSMLHAVPSMLHAAPSMLLAAPFMLLVAPSILLAVLPEVSSIWMSSSSNVILPSSCTKQGMPIAPRALIVVNSVRVSRRCRKDLSERTCCPMSTMLKCGLPFSCSFTCAQSAQDSIT